VNCTDCKEPITEAERKNARTCLLCNGMLHAECSMAGVNEEDLCEECHLMQSTFNLKALKILGAS
jgi:hypothetical protein